MNFESLPINFCNRKFLNIKSDDYKKYLLDFIKTNWNVDITKKKYRSYRPENKKIVEEYQSIISTVSLGNMYYMFVYKDKYSQMPRCYMIDGRTLKGYDFPKMVTIYLRFKSNVFDGTLLKGELIKDNDNNWIFLIDDVFVYCGKKVMENKIKRIELTTKLINSELKHDSFIQPFSIQIKKYFNPSEINYVVNEFIPKLNYQCRGIMIHTNHRIYNNLFCNFTNVVRKEPKRMKYDKPTPKFVKPTTITKNIKMVVNKTISPKKNKTSSTFKELDTIKIKIDSKEVIETKNDIHIGDYDKEKCAILNLVKTEHPDVYKLYAWSELKEKMKRVGYANVPNIDTSKYLQNLFIDEDNEDENYNVVCEYNSETKKWTPKEKIDADTPDSVDFVKNLKKKLKN